MDDEPTPNTEDRPTPATGRDGAAAMAILVLTAVLIAFVVSRIV